MKEVYYQAVHPEISIQIIKRLNNERNDKQFFEKRKIRCLILYKLQ